MKNKSYQFTVACDPLLISRARIRDGKFCNASQEIKFMWKSHLEKQFEGNNILGRSPLAIDMTFYFPLPFSMCSEKKNNAEEALTIAGPELSKMIKFILAACEGVIYDSDTKICSLTARKCYSKDPRCTFILTDTRN